MREGSPTSRPWPQLSAASIQAVPRSEPLIEPIVDALAKIGAEAIIPAQCAGWRAGHAFTQAMPHAYILDCVGPRLELHYRQLS